MKKAKKALATLAIMGMTLTMVPLNAYAAIGVTTDRLFGPDRIGTAINVAEKFVSANTAIIAPSANANLVDALAAAPLAGKNSPILLTEKDTLNLATKAELIKLKVTKVYVVGAIDQLVVDQVRAIPGVTVISLKGSNRIETAAQISSKLTNIAGSFVVGYNALPDALSVASYAAANNYSILVANPDGSLPVSEVAYKGAKVYAVGGSTLVKDIAGATRLAGADRYATNKVVLETLSYSYNKVYVANGTDEHLVDSLVASSLAALAGAPIILTDTAANGDAATAYIGAELANNEVVVALGGPTVVLDTTLTKVTSAVPATLSVSSVTAINAIKVAYGTAVANVGLPVKVTLKLSNGTTKDVGLTWTSATYDGTKTASYIFKGAYALPEGVTGTMPVVTANVMVGANNDLADVDAAKVAVTALETAAAKDLTVETTLTVAEALVQPAKDAVKLVDDATGKAALEAKVIAAEKAVTDARTKFNALLVVDYTYTVTAGKTQITKYKGAGGVVTIPSTLGGSPVTSIGDNAFQYCTGLTSLSIPESVTSIGYGAFGDCSRLTTISIPEGVTSIGHQAFLNCGGLTSINIPQGVTNISDGTFYGCTGLTSVSIPQGVTSIGSNAFWGCGGLTSLSLPEGVISIGICAFSYCDHLTTLIIPEGVTSIANSAFSSCLALTSLNIPDGVTSIGNSAFSCCSNLTSVSLPEGVTSVGSNAFSGCTSLTSIRFNSATTMIFDGEDVIPTTTKMIGFDPSTAKTYATKYHKTFEVIPADKTELITALVNATTLIGSKTVGDADGQVSQANHDAYQAAIVTTTAVKNDAGARQAEVDAAVTTLGAAMTAFNSLIVIPIAVTLVSLNKNETTIDVGSNEILTAAIAPTTATNKNVTWQSNNTAIATVDANGKVVGVSAGTTVITVTTADKSKSSTCSIQVQPIAVDYTYTVIDGKAQITGYIGAGGAVTIPSTLDGFPVTMIGSNAFYAKGPLVTSISIPEGVTSIGDGAFYCCTRLTSLIIPQSVTSIGDWAFMYCTSLTSLSIPQGVTSIGDSAFDNCTGLTSISLPQGITSISNYAFQYCSALTTINIPEGVTSIGDGAFYSCSSLISVSIPVGVTSIGSWAFEDCIGLTSIIIPEGVTSIGSYAFEYCMGLTSIIIPEGVTNIGSYAFQYCMGLTSISLPQGVTSISNYAFRYCKSLTSISIPETVTSIGDGAFENCMSLISINIPQGVTSIGNRVFWDCNSLTSISIPQGVTSIGDWAFYHCLSLTSISIPERVTSIGDSAFQYSTGLTSIVIPESVTSIGDNAFSYCAGLTSISIPQGVTSIGDGAFQNCTGLTSISIPKGVTSISDLAFYECTGLTSITFNSATTTIYDDAYTIPDTTRIIGYASSTAKDYATNYGRTFEVIDTTNPLQ